MLDQDGQQQSKVLMTPGTGEVLGCRLGSHASLVVARWPGGRFVSSRSGLRTYTLTQEVGRCRARLILSFAFLDERLSALSMRGAEAREDGLGRHAFKQLVRELSELLPEPPLMQDEGYREYDMGLVRVVVDELDTVIRFEESL